MLLGTDDDEDEPDPPSEPLDHLDEAILGDISSLNTLAGQSNPRSLCLYGEVGNHKFQVLIDSGSTHNFIRPSLAKKL